MSKIVGVTVGTPLSPRSIKEKLQIVTSVNGAKPDAEGNVEIPKGATSWNDLTDKPSVPTKLSELENDKGYALSSDIPTVPTKLSELENDSGFITVEDIPEIPEGGASSWNDLTDKPFGEEQAFEPVVIDCNVEGLESLVGVVAVPIYRFSEKYIPVEEVDCIVGYFNNQQQVMPTDEIQTYKDGWAASNAIIVVSNGSETFGGDAVIPEGVWAIDLNQINNDPSTKIIIKPTTTIKPIDEKYLPDSVVLEDELGGAIEDALAQAKASGEFDGKDGEPGYTPVKGTDYFTEADKAEIAEMTAELVDVPEGGGDSGPAIIDVVELPTENIDENSFYRLLSGRFVYNQHVYNHWICNCVENFPDVGGPAISGDISNIDAYYNYCVTVYHDIISGEVKAYITQDLAPVFGVPAGWYPAETLFMAVGNRFSGTITNILDDPCDDSYRLLLEYINYSYKDGWTSFKTIGMRGTGLSAEIFNSPLNEASSAHSHAEGWTTTASGDASHAEGCETTASGYHSHAEGSSTTASGDASHAEGSSTTASGYSSHAEGIDTTSSGASSHAEGSTTTASGTTSHAEGWFTTASGDHSHAEGSNTTASSVDSHSEGQGTIAAGRSQHVQGENNVVDPEYDVNNASKRTKYAHIVGNGTGDNDRSNAHTLDWNGLGWFAGGLKVGGTGQDDENAKEVVLTVNGQTPDANGNVVVEAGGAASVPDEDMIELLMEMDIVQPVANTNGVIYTDNNNKVYVL